MGLPTAYGSAGCGLRVRLVVVGEMVRMAIPIISIGAGSLRLQVIDQKSQTAIEVSRVFDFLRPIAVDYDCRLSGCPIH